MVVYLYPTKLGKDNALETSLIKLCLNTNTKCLYLDLESFYCVQVLMFLPSLACEDGALSITKTPMVF